MVKFTDKCLQCRVSKGKANICNGGQPACSRCVKRGIQCSYDSVPATATNSSSDAAASSSATGASPVMSSITAVVTPTDYGFDFEPAPHATATGFSSNVNTDFTNPFESNNDDYLNSSSYGHNAFALSDNPLAANTSFLNFQDNSTRAFNNTFVNPSNIMSDSNQPPRPRTPDWIDCIALNKAAEKAEVARQAADPQSPMNTMTWAEGLAANENAERVRAALSVELPRSPGWVTIVPHQIIPQGTPIPLPDEVMVAIGRRHLVEKFGSGAVQGNPDEHADVKAWLDYQVMENRRREEKRVAAAEKARVDYEEFDQWFDYNAYERDMDAIAKEKAEKMNGNGSGNDGGKGEGGIGGISA